MKLAARSVARRILAASLLVAYASSAAEAQSGQVPFKPRLDAVDEEEFEETGSGTAKTKSSKAPSFSKYSRHFSRWCRLLDKDGRRDAYFLILERISEESTDCLGCRAFLRSASLPCKPRRSAPKKKQPEPEQTPEAAVPEVYRQREPSAELLDAVSTAMIEIREDQKRAPDAAQAIDRLAHALRDPDGKTPGEHDYFEILAEYLHAPMAALLITPVAATDSEGGEVREIEPQKVDDLFSF